MSQRVLISVMVFFFLKVSALYAQVPTLNPEQTVNPANGRMEFSLPLGTVKGVNGYDFPIMLNYQSGIRVDQEASDVGLGFSCMAGSITRRVVNVPDDNNGPYTFENARFTECGNESWDKALFSFFITVAECFATIFCPPIGSAISFAHNMASLSGLEPSSSDYLPNGIESYDYAHNRGVGFFQGGNATDLPDNYFVSTPYISGQLAWVGDPASGHFVFKHALGSTVNDFETIKVDYHYNEGFQKEYWTIKLPDGRKLVFNAKDNYGNLMNVRAEGNILNDERSCHALFSDLSLKEPSPSTWYLTAVLGPDYVDGDNDPEPEDPADGTQNKGSWIAFQYNPITIYPGWHKTSVDLQACLYGSYYTNEYGGYTNGSVNKIYNQLSKIITPNESTEFNYTETRLDDLWIGSNDYFKGIKRLNSLSIKTKSNVVRQSVVFNADYTLRPGSHHSYLKPDGCSNGYINPPPGNSHGACLTLNSIVVQAYDGGVIAKQYPVFFIYDPLKNPDITLRKGWTDPHYAPKPVPTPVLVEHKDLWDYYSRNTTGTPNTPDYHNDFNPQGLLSKEQETDSWSLKSISFPSGMTIEWSYEPNRYDRLNGNRVTSDQGAPRYGGGIRVSKMTVNNGSGNSAETWNYFYTSTNGNFVEVNNNSSGYATIEPFDYTLREKNDGLSGGHYTSDMVGYEKVQVVKNYNALSTPHAPNGYTVYDFTHAGDPAVNGYHPNGGYDGKIDSSWTRGLLLAKSIFNSTDKLVSKVENNYEFVPLITVRNPVSNDVLDPLFREMQANTVGWARIQKVETTVNGVKQTKTFKYANNDVQSPDLDVRAVTSIGMLNCHALYADLIPSTSRSLICDNWREDGSMGADGKKDLVLIAPPFNPNSCTDATMWIWINYEDKKSFNVYRASYCYGVGTVIPGYGGIDFILGMKFFDLDSDGQQNDLVLIYKDGVYILSVAFHDIAISNSRITTTGGSDGSLGKNVRPLFQNPNNNGINIQSCGIVDLDGNGIQDIIFVTGSMDNLFDHSAKQLLVYKDWTELAPTKTPLTTTNSWEVWGKNITCGQYQDNGVTKHNVILTGLDPNNKVRKSIFRDITLNGNSVIVGGTGSPEEQITPITCGNSIGTDRARWLCGMDSSVADKKELYVYATSEPRLAVIDLYHNPAACSDLDGQPNEVWQTAPNNKYLVTKTIPAYWKSQYTDMLTQHILTQPCQTITYEKAISDATPLSDADVRSSQATTWSSSLGNSIWVPNYSFAWNNQKGAYSDFVFPNPPADPSSQNPSWQYTGSVEKYNSYSAPVELKNGKKISSATVYRNDLNIPIGSIANSQYGECAVFTCDYDMNTNNFFDEPNGWKHYNTKPTGAVCALVSVTPPHFGEKCLHVTNCQAAAKTIAIHSRTAKITYSAWVCPQDDKPIRFAACLVENGTGNNAIYYDYEYNTSNGLIADGVTWQFVKFTIDISKPVSGTLPASFDGVATESGVDGIYVWVGNHPGDPVSDFYIEDIRIYPAKSLVTTTYYDSKWQQPILTVDANGNPSQKIVYDDFGRPFQWYKIDKTTANLTLLQQKEYHLMADFYTPNPNKWYKIVPEKDESFCIDIKDASWTDGYAVHLWTYTGALNQIWKFVPDGSNFKIESKGGGGTAFRLSAPDLDDNRALMIKSTVGGTQLWKLTDAGDGFCRISASTDDTKYIDLDKNDAKDYGKVQIYTGGLFSKWKLVEVP